MDSEEFFLRCRLRDAQGLGLDEPGFGNTLSEKGVFFNGKGVPFWKGKDEGIGEK